MTSLDPLLPYLYDGYTDTWTPAQWAILRALAEGCNPGGRAEPAVTKMLCAVGGPIGHSLANIFLDTAGRPASPNAEMVDLDIQIARSSRRVPDIGIRDAVADQLLLVAEGKRDAHINVGKCGLDPDGSGSQVICYLHGCWTSPDALKGAAFLWLHPSDIDPWKECWHDMHLDNPTYVERAGGQERLRRWIDTERAATRQWRTATWEDLVARVRDLREPAADVIAAIIGTWLGR